LSSALYLEVSLRDQVDALAKDPGFGQLDEHTALTYVKKVGEKLAVIKKTASEEEQQWWRSAHEALKARKAVFTAAKRAKAHTKHKAGSGKVREGIRMLREAVDLAEEGLAEQEKVADDLVAVAGDEGMPTQPGSSSAASSSGQQPQQQAPQEPPQPGEQVQQPQAAAAAAVDGSEPPAKRLRPEPPQEPPQLEAVAAKDASVAAEAEAEAVVAAKDASVAAEEEDGDEVTEESRGAAIGGEEDLRRCGEPVEVCVRRVLHQGPTIEVGDPRPGGTNSRRGDQTGDCETGDRVHAAGLRQGRGSKRGR